MPPLTEIFCLIDDFCKIFEQESAKITLPPCKKNTRTRNRKSRTSLSEIMTILILFQLSGYSNFKDFYIKSILVHYKQHFPGIVGYQRFIALSAMAAMPLFVLILGIRGRKTGIYFVDSTKLPVCDNLRIKRNKVFKDLAKRGKTSTGWFFGFKLHIIVNNLGEIVNFTLTKGNVDDRKPLEKLAQNLRGWCVGDRGYLGKKLKDSLMEKGLKLITHVKKGMKEMILSGFEKKLLKKRNIIETIFDQLKNILRLDHSRHRSVTGFIINVLSALIAYCFKPRKPSASFSDLNNLSIALIQNSG